MKCPISNFGIYIFRYIVNYGGFIAGDIMCKFTAFLDFTMATEYPMILIVFAIILLTRKFPKLEDTLDQLPMNEMIHHDGMNSSRHSDYRNGSRPPSAYQGRPPSVQGSRHGSRPPSVQGGGRASRASSIQGGRAPSLIGGLKPSPGSRPPSVSG